MHFKIQSIPHLYIPIILQSFLERLGQKILFVELFGLRHMFKTITH